MEKVAIVIASHDLLNCTAELPVTLLWLSIQKEKDRNCFCLIWTKVSHGKEETYLGLYVGYINNPPETYRQISKNWIQCQRNTMLLTDTSNKQEDQVLRLFYLKLC